MSEVAANSAPLSEGGRLLGVLLDPPAAFADIAGRPRWWVPLLLLTLLNVLFTYSFSERVGWERFIRQQLSTHPRLQELPAEQREQIAEQQARVAGRFGYAAAVLSFAVLCLLVAAVLLFVFNVLVGTELRFQQMFALTAYAFLPYALASLGSLAVLFLKDPEEFDLQNPLGSNLAALLEPGSARWLVSLGTALDLFSLWTVLLLATGVSAAARRLAWRRACLWVVVAWVFWMAVKTGWVVIFG